MTEQIDTRTGIKFGFTAGDDDWGGAFNRNFQLLAYEGPHILILETARNTPPATPSEGDCYTVGSSPTGAWAGWVENSLAVWGYPSTGGNTLMWINFTPPKKGITAYVDATSAFVIYNGSTWASQAGVSSSAVSSAISRALKQADWDQTDSSQTDFIKNKPTTITVAQATLIASALQSVVSDLTLSGLGTTASPLMVANPFTSADETKLDAIESGATADQTGDEIVTLLEAQPTTPTDKRLDASAIKNLPTGNTGSMWSDVTNKPPTATRWPAFSEVTGTAAVTQLPTIPTTKISGLATVATSGSYTDLSNRPTIPTAINDNRLIPDGGTADQVLTKSSDSDYAVTWSSKAAATSGLTSVSSDATLLGAGTATDQLRVANPFTSADETKLDAALTTVATDATIDGDGTTATPLKLPSAITDKLDLLDPDQPNFNTEKFQYQADWDETNTAAYGYIQNKPTIPTAVGATVVSDATLTGTGAAGDVLKVAIPYTQAEKDKLAALPSDATDDQTATEIRDSLLTLTSPWIPYSRITGAPTIPANQGEPNVQSDWTETDPSDDSYIQNKPTLPSSLTNRVLPIGGSTGQVLKKTSATNFAVEWADDETGSGGGGGGSSRTDAQVQELARDAVYAALDAGSTTTGDLVWTENDSANTITATIRPDSVNTAELSDDITSRLVPTGGAIGQVLKRIGSSFGWGTDETATGGTGLDQAAVDARVRMLVANWAEEGNSDDVPDDKLPATATSWPTYAQVTGTKPPADAEQNVQSDWTETSTTSDAYIQNKPATVSKANAEAGTLTDVRQWTPERVRQAIEALETSTWSGITGKPGIVTQAEAEAGTVTDVRLFTPQRVKQAIDKLATSGSDELILTTTPANATTTTLSAITGSVTVVLGNTIRPTTDMLAIGVTGTYFLELEIKCELQSNVANNDVYVQSAWRDTINSRGASGDGIELTTTNWTSATLHAVITNPVNTTYQPQLHITNGGANAARVSYRNVTVSLYTKPILSLGELSDVFLGTLSDNQVLRYSSSQKRFVNATMTLPTTLGALTDVTLTSPTAGQALKYDTATSMWTNQADATGGAGNPLVLTTSAAAVVTTSIASGSTATSINIGTALTPNSEILSFIRTSAWTGEFELRIALRVTDATKPITVAAVAKRGTTEVGRSVAQVVDDTTTTAHVFHLDTTVTGAAHQVSLEATHGESTAQNLISSTATVSLYIKQVELPATLPVHLAEFPLLYVTRDTSFPADHLLIRSTTGSIPETLLVGTTFNLFHGGTATSQTGVTGNPFTVKERISGGAGSTSQYIQINKNVTFTSSAQPTSRTMFGAEVYYLVVGMRATSESAPLHSYDPSESFSLESTNTMARGVAYNSVRNIISVVDNGVTKQHFAYSPTGGGTAIAKYTKTLAGTPIDLAWDPDGRHLYVAEERTFKVYDWGADASAATLTPTRVTSKEFSVNLHAIQAIEVTATQVLILCQRFVGSPKVILRYTKTGTLSSSIETGATNDIDGLISDDNVTSLWTKRPTYISSQSLNSQATSFSSYRIRLPDVGLVSTSMDSTRQMFFSGDYFYDTTNMHAYNYVTDGTRQSITGASFSGNKFWGLQAGSTIYIFSLSSTSFNPTFYLQRATISGANITLQGTRLTGTTNATGVYGRGSFALARNKLFWISTFTTFNPKFRAYNLTGPSTGYTALSSSSTEVSITGLSGALQGSRSSFFAYNDVLYLSTAEGNDTYLYSIADNGAATLVRTIIRSHSYGIGINPKYPNILYGLSGSRNLLYTVNISDTETTPSLSFQRRVSFPINVGEGGQDETGLGYNRSADKFFITSRTKLSVYDEDTARTERAWLAFAGNQFWGSGTYGMFMSDATTINILSGSHINRYEYPTLNFLGSVNLNRTLYGGFYHNGFYYLVTSSGLQRYNVETKTALETVSFSGTMPAPNTSSQNFTAHVEGTTIYLGSVSIYAYYWATIPSTGNITSITTSSANSIRSGYYDSSIFSWNGYLYLGFVFSSGVTYRAYRITDRVAVSGQNFSIRPGTANSVTNTIIAPNDRLFLATSGGRVYPYVYV